MGVRVLPSSVGHIRFKALDGQLLPVNHPKALAEDERQFRPVRFEGAHTVKVLGGTLDFMTMPQGARGVHERSQIIRVFVRSFYE